jgi:uncharacterized membrane-anchored protein YhcB (DUF1043 family)
MVTARVQEQLDNGVRRVDQELARSASEYDEARKATAKHHGTADALVKELEVKLKPLQERLLAVMEGKAQAGPDYEQMVEDYQNLTRELSQARQARRMTFGSTQPPGEVPTGKPLGAVSAVETDSDDLPPASREAADNPQ